MKQASQSSLLTQSPLISIHSPGVVCFSTDLGREATAWYRVVNHGPPSLSLIMHIYLHRLRVFCREQTSSNGVDQVFFRLKNTDVLTITYTAAPVYSSRFVADRINRGFAMKLRHLVSRKLADGIKHEGANTQDVILFSLILRKNKLLNR